MGAIIKINLYTEKNQIITIKKSELEKFFLISKINPRKIISTLSIKELNKRGVLKILFAAAFRKILRKKPALTEQAIMSLIKSKKFKKIIKIEVSLPKGTLTFNLEKIHLLNLLGDLRGVIENNQYNLNEKNIKNKIIIDAGSHNGEFAILAVLMGAKKVYAFEPVSNTAKILRENIKLNHMENKIFVVEKALGDLDGFENIFFDFTGDGAASIVSKSGKKNFEKIEIIRLDSFAKKEKIKRVDMIKMDIEGFEANALLGAEKIIKQFKPILSFSAYHKPEDKVILPKIVKKLREDYKIVLNKFDEEDFYCY